MARYSSLGHLTPNEFVGQRQVIQAAKTPSLLAKIRFGAGQRQDDKSSIMWSSFLGERQSSHTLIPEDLYRGVHPKVMC